MDRVGGQILIQRNLLRQHLRHRLLDLRQQVRQAARHAQIGKEWRERRLLGHCGLSCDRHRERLERGQRIGRRDGIRRQIGGKARCQRRRKRKDGIGGRAGTCARLAGLAGRRARLVDDRKPDAARCLRDLQLKRLAGLKRHLRCGLYGLVADGDLHLVIAQHLQNFSRDHLPRLQHDPARCRRAWRRRRGRLNIRSDRDGHDSPGEANLKLAPRRKPAVNRDASGEAFSRLDAAL